MIKRRFYQQDRGDKSGSSSTDSSSSSDPDSDSATKEGKEEEEEEEEEEEDELEQQVEADKDEGEQEREDCRKPLSLSPSPSPSPGSGYESEDSSGNVLDGNYSVADEEEDGSEGGRGNHQGRAFIRNIHDGESNCVDAGHSSPKIDDPSAPDFAGCILKCKSVFKCRLCPRIICLSEQTVRAHLVSKRHARSKKLLCEGRLKLMLNSDGELEEDQETHAERHSRTIALAQEPLASKKKDAGRQRQSRRRKKRLRNRSEKQIEQPMNNLTKRRHKTEE